MAQMRIAVVLLALGAAFLAAPGGAGAANPIEGVWTFHGGKAAIQAQPAGAIGNYEIVAVGML